MDGVIAVAERCEQADLGGAVEQGDARLAGQAAHLGQTPVGLGIAHHPQHVHIHEALEEVQQGQLLAFVLVERVVEAVAERRAQRPGAALARLVVERRLAGAQLRHEVVDLLLRGQAVAEGLADQHGDRQRVALGEPQQRPPVVDVVDPPPVLLGQGPGQLDPLLHRHRRDLDPAGQVAQPVLARRGGR